MDWITTIGTIAIGAVLIISLLAMFDILFLKPTSRTKRSRSTDGLKGTGGSLPKDELPVSGRRRQRLADKKS